MYNVGTVLTVPEGLTHLHPECEVVVTEWREGFGGILTVQSASLPGLEHPVHVNEFGNPILCQCLAWTKKDPPPLFVLCWHVNRVQYHTDQYHKAKRTQKENAPLNGAAGVHLMR